MKILKQLSFYVGTLIFVMLVAFSMPFVMKCKGPQQSVTILEVVRHPDTTFSVIMQDRAYDALYEHELDSIMNTLKH